MSFEVDYEEDLVPRIRDLIDGYSKDSILKEYLQNADDSQATELIVTFDRRNHNSLKGTQYDAAQTPALLLYNNSKFNDNDFKSIVKISAQGKTKDARSTGRFGQGFSSSFSISDYPSLISNGKALWFDVLKNSVSKNGGKSIQGWEEKDFDQIRPWLDTFSSVYSSFNGTIFRLPLRTEETAKASKISGEIFTYEDFLKWCDEWKNSADSLLFLRHLHKLVLQEIDITGKKVLHVEIKTDNPEKVEDVSAEIQKEFTGSLVNICSKWKGQKDELPTFKYNHHFSITYKEEKGYKKRKEKWAVVNGLFRGESDSLIEQANKVLKISPNPRKVLPWAGVAVRIDDKNKAQKSDKSKIYTFLPLPIKSKHPVHIHGWFDLNPKRTEITHDGTGADKETLIEWNNLLFKEGVGRAWALLIDFIKEQCSSKNYYTFWVKPSDTEQDGYLLEGFYSYIAELECLNTHHKKSKKWCKPTDNIYSFQKNSNRKL